ncbi:flavodoxin [Frankia sp. AgPm24]|uniref:flavodoxin n=1 Tax=Frankia sp. AgPm24 TaxID=631128 RepID=UPI00200D6453|nr:flavodoxin [Frankia sp. AgPm24]
MAHGHGRAGEEIKRGDTLCSGSAHSIFGTFCDQAYYPCLEATIGRPYALYVHGGSDTTGAVRSVETIATGLKWKRLREPLSIVGEVDATGHEACWELGATVAASLMSA